MVLKACTPWDKELSRLCPAVRTDNATSWPEP
jgi:hypothetical protein